MSFETEVELSLTVPRRELRSAREQIESGLGSVNTGASAAAGGGGAGQARSRNRRLFRWARQRTESLDSIVTILEDIDFEGGGGGGGLGLPGFGAGIGGVSTLAGGAITAGALIAGSVPASALIAGTVAAAALIAPEDLTISDLIDTEPATETLPGGRTERTPGTVGSDDGPGLTGGGFPPTTGGGGRAAGLTSRQVEEIVNRIAPNLGPGGGGRGPAGQVNIEFGDITAEIQPDVRDAIDDVITNQLTDDVQRRMDDLEQEIERAARTGGLPRI